MKSLSLLLTSMGLWNLTLGETVVLFLAAVCVIFLIVFIIKCFATKRPVTIEIDGKVIEQTPNKKSKKNKQVQKEQQKEGLSSQPYTIAPASNKNFAYNFQMIEQTNMQNVIPSEYFFAKEVATANNQEIVTSESSDTEVEPPKCIVEVETQPTKAVKVSASLTKEELEILSKCNIDSSILNSQNNEELMIVIKKIITKYKKNEILARIDKIQTDINNLSSYISTIKNSAN